MKERRRRQDEGNYRAARKRRINGHYESKNSHQTFCATMYQWTNC